MEVTHPKEGKIVWICVDYNIVDKRGENKEKGLHRFDYTLFEENKYEKV